MSALSMSSWQRVLLASALVPCGGEKAIRGDGDRGERWPPVCDLDELVAEIKRLLLNACLVRFLARDDGRYE